VKKTPLVKVVKGAKKTLLGKIDEHQYIRTTQHGMKTILGKYKTRITIG